MNNGIPGDGASVAADLLAQPLPGVDPTAQPDFVKLAEAYGGVGLEVADAKEVRRALEWAMEINDRPCSLNFRVAREENVYPMIPAMGSIDQMLID